MLSLPKEAVGAIIAAFVAGVISLIGLIISKEQKVSDFRQSWIDGLRSDVSATIAHLIAVRALWKDNNCTKPVFSVTKEQWIAVNQGITCIRLRLNADDDSSKTLLDSLCAVEALFQQQDVATSEEIIPALEKLTALCSIVMKEEWNKVKEGEPTYRRARRTALIAAVCALPLAILAFIGSKPKFDQNSIAPEDQSKHISNYFLPQTRSKDSPHKQTETAKPKPQIAQHH